VRDVANPVPALVTLDFLGLELSEWHGYADAIHSGARRAPGSGQKLKWLMNEVDAVVRRSDLHQDGLIAWLLSTELDSERLSDGMIREIVFTLLNGGIDTTTSMIANAVVQIDARPDLRGALRQDSGTVPATVQELLRYCGPSIGVARTAVAEAELGDVSVAPGDRALFLVASANLDASRFDDPDRFDAGRSPNPHLSFGYGAHRCLGAELATAELEIFVAALMERFPNFVVDRHGVVPYRTIPLVNGFAAVPISFSADGRQPSDGGPLPKLTKPRLRPAV
jgi:cytochrome P450